MERWNFVGFSGVPQGGVANPEVGGRFLQRHPSISLAT
jgi:hypothetical protein